MSRDQRASDNWALIHAQAHALDRKAPLAVVFCLVPSFLGATVRQYDFMIRGLEEVCGKLREKGIPFYLLKGEPAQQIPSFAKKHKASALITDLPGELSPPEEASFCMERKGSIHSLG
jgi:deoxyribodipyrimidine photo-lyase